MTKKACVLKLSKDITQKPMRKKVIAFCINQ